jgi:hypothetical protein
MTKLAQKQEELIKLLDDQILQVELALYSYEHLIRLRKGNLAELTMIHKMELGDDVISEIQKLQHEIDIIKSEQQD